MNVPDANALAVLRRIGVSIKIDDPAIRCLLMPVIGDGAHRHRERRKRTRLPLVMSSLDEMEEMIVGPMTRLDNRTTLSVPGDAVGIARPLGDNLKFVRARVHAPQGGVEFVV